MKLRYVFMLLCVVCVWSYAVGWHLGFKEAERQGIEAQRKLVAEYSQSIDTLLKMMKPSQVLALCGYSRGSSGGVGKTTD